LIANLHQKNGENNSINWSIWSQQEKRRDDDENDWHNEDDELEKLNGKTSNKLMLNNSCGEKQQRDEKKNETPKIINKINLKLSKREKRWKQRGKEKI